MRDMGKILNYKILGTALKSLSDACFKADEQQRNGEKVTACGMSDDDLDRLCDIIPDMLNPMLSTEEVKEKLHVSDATLNRMVARGDIPHGECKKRGHTRYWKKWDILHFIKSKRESSRIKPYRSTDKRVYMSIKDFMFFALIIVAILVIINCTFVAYLYLSYEYKKVNKFFLSWVTVSTMILIMWFGVGLYLYFEHFL